MRDYRAELRGLRDEIAELEGALADKFAERNQLIVEAKEYGLQTAMIIEDSGVTQQRISQILTAGRRQPAEV